MVGIVVVEDDVWMSHPKHFMTLYTSSKMAFHTASLHTHTHTRTQTHTHTHTVSARPLSVSSSLPLSSRQSSVRRSSCACRPLLSDCSWAFLLVSFSVKPSSSAS